MSYPTELIRQVRSGNPEAEVRRAARVDYLEEYVCRGDYRVPSREIVTALLLNAALTRARPLSLPPDAR